MCSAAGQTSGGGDEAGGGSGGRVRELEQYLGVNVTQLLFLKNAI